MWRTEKNLTYVTRIPEKKGERDQSIINIWWDTIWELPRIDEKHCPKQWKLPAHRRQGEVEKEEPTHAPRILTKPHYTEDADLLPAVERAESSTWVTGWTLPDQEQSRKPGPQNVSEGSRVPPCIQPGAPCCVKTGKLDQTAYSRIREH